jgi:hypothetical protein
VSEDAKLPFGVLIERSVASLEDSYSSIGAFCEALRQHGLRVCAVEDLERSPALNFPPSSSRPGSALAPVLECLSQAGYRWEMACGELVNILPKRSVLDDPIPPVKFEDKPLWRVLDDDLRIEERGVRLFAELQQTEAPRVTVACPPATLREALNLLVVQLPGAFWNISGTAGTYFLSISSV